MGCVGPSTGDVADAGLVIGAKWGLEELELAVGPTLGPAAATEALLFFGPSSRLGVAGSAFEFGAEVATPTVVATLGGAGEELVSATLLVVGVVVVTDEVVGTSTMRSAAPHGRNHTNDAAAPPASTSARRAGRRHQTRARRRCLAARASKTRSKRSAGGVASACSSACRKSLSIKGLSCMDRGGDGVQSDL